MGEMQPPTRRYTTHMLMVSHIQNHVQRWNLNFSNSFFKLYGHNMYTHCHNMWPSCVHLDKPIQTISKSIIFVGLVVMN